MVPKICEMVGVREHAEGDPVELWRDEDTGRLVIRASNECGNNSTRVDLFDLVDWLSTKQLSEFADQIEATPPARQENDDVFKGFRGNNEA